MESETEEEDCFVIGIDFGTTFSGVAWCWSGQPDGIEHVTRWKTKLNLVADNAKTPSEIFYPLDGGEIRWGYDVPLDEEPIRWFKLLLVSEEDLSPDLQKSAQIKRARELVRVREQDPIDVVADYLRLLWAHALEDIVRDRGKSALAGSPFKVWITVPAIWEPDARERMLKAAEKAGITQRRAIGPTTVDFVAEPEAAALSVLDEYYGRPDIKANDVLVVCDAGGGTVDMISYKVISPKPMTVQECVEGKGKMCGAIFVDEAFVNILRAILGEKWDRLSAAGKKSMINTEWEHGIKRVFDDSERDKVWNVTIPHEAFAKNTFEVESFATEGPAMRSDHVQLKTGHVKMIFQTVFGSIRDLIHQQIRAIERKEKKLPKKLLLVGGFGSCNYLYQQLKTEFEDHKGIEVLQPRASRAWPAICRGAVIRGLNNTEIQLKRRNLIVSRISRYSYGMAHTDEYDKDKHDAEHREWDKDELKWIVRGQMEWCLRKGDDIDHKEPMRVKMYRLFRNPANLEKDSTFAIQLYSNNEEEAPSRKTDRVKPLVPLVVTVPRPFDQFPSIRNKKGETLYKILHEVEMASTGVSMNWSVRINGKVCGEQNVKVKDNTWI